MTSAYISREVERRVRQMAQDRCGYCLSQQQYVFAPLEIEHIVPRALDGTSNEENLWLACPLCNSYKGVQCEGIDPLTHEVVPLFNPRMQKWQEHFAWSEDSTQIVGQTACGRATVIALQLNNIIAVTVRRAWVSAGWHPPTS